MLLWKAQVFLITTVLLSDAHIFKEPIILCGKPGESVGLNFSCLGTIFVARLPDLNNKYIDIVYTHIWGEPSIGTDKYKIHHHDGGICELITYDLEITDAGEYRLSFGTDITVQYVIYVWDKPRRAEISLEDNKLICSSFVTSEPHKYAPDLLYTYFMDGVVWNKTTQTDNFIVVPRCDQTVKPAEFACSARENGSPFSSGRSKNLSVERVCIPGNTKLSTQKGMTSTINSQMNEGTMDASIFTSSVTDGSVTGGSMHFFQTLGLLMIGVVFVVTFTTIAIFVCCVTIMKERRKRRESRERRDLAFSAKYKVTTSREYEDITELVDNDLFDSRMDQDSEEKLSHIYSEVKPSKQFPERFSI